MSKQKRPLSAPIFNKGKRPRPALVTHPNNQGSISHEAITQDFRRDQHMNVSENYSSQWKQQSYSQQSDTGHSFRIGNNHQPHFNQSSCEQTTPMYRQPLSNLNKRFPVEPTPATTGSILAKAQEPTERAQTERGLNKAKKPHQMRVITATAQGVEHWSQYRQHTQLLFEVYGSLSLLLARRNKIEQEFTLNSVDGAIRCIYWEMEAPFPSISQEQLVRVVGSLDARNKRLKCYSVRPVRRGEEKDTISRCVTLADGHMRQMAARIG